MKFLILRHSAVMRKLLDMIPTLLSYRATPSQEARALLTRPLPSALSEGEREGMDLSPPPPSSTTNHPSLDILDRPYTCPLRGLCEDFVNRWFWRRDAVCKGVIMSFQNI